MAHYVLGDGRKVAFHSSLLPVADCTFLRSYVETRFIADNARYIKGKKCFNGPKYVNFHANADMASRISGLLLHHAQLIWPFLTRIDDSIYIVRYDAHVRHPASDIHRDALPGKIQALLYLNEEYPGGDITTFDEQKQVVVREKPKTGSVLFMPCGVLHQAGEIPGPGNESKYLIVVSFH